MQIQDGEFDVFWYNYAFPYVNNERLQYRKIDYLQYNEIQKSKVTKTKLIQISRDFEIQLGL